MKGYYSHLTKAEVFMIQNYLSIKVLIKLLTYVYNSTIYQKKNDCFPITRITHNNKFNFRVRKYKPNFENIIVSKKPINSEID